MASSRGKNYSNEELKQLCNSVLYISQDPCIGVGQRVERFWERVTEHYKKNKPSGSGEGRARKSLESKWVDVKHDCAKFIGTYQQVEQLHISGSNDEDTFIKAKELYKQNHPQGKTFTFESCFWILKECPRWRSPVDDMASKKQSKSKSRSRSDELDLNQTSPSSPTINLDSEVDLAQPGNEPDETRATEHVRRPLGNKRAKDDAKRQRLEQDFMKESLRVQGLMANATLARNEFNQGKGTLLKLLQIPTANLAPRVQEIVARWTLAEADLIEKKLDEMQASTDTTKQHRVVDLEPEQSRRVIDLEPEQRRPPLVEVEFQGPNVYVPDTTDPHAFMAEIERQFQGRPFCENT